MAGRTRYAVKQIVYIWADSPGQAARLVRHRQLTPKGDGPNDYSDFVVTELVERFDGSYQERDNLRYGICLFDRDVLPVKV